MARMWAQRTQAGATDRGDGCGVHVVVGVFARKHVRAAPTARKILSQHIHTHAHAYTHAHTPLTHMHTCTHTYPCYAYTRAWPCERRGEISKEKKRGREKRKGKHTHTHTRLYLVKRVCRRLVGDRRQPGHAPNAHRNTHQTHT